MEVYENCSAFMRHLRKTEAGVTNVIFWRSVFFLTGIVLLSFGLSMMIQAPIIGVNSWDVLHIGLTDTFGLTIGLWTILLGVLIIAVEASIMRRLPKIGTILDMILAGILIDVFNYILPTITGVMGQIVFFIVGVFIYGFGVGMYIVANIGVGPRDSFMLLLSHKFGWSVGKSRTVMEVLVAIVGFFLGGPIGIGTVVMAFCLGPIMQWALRYNEKLFLYVTGEAATVYN